MFGRGKQPSDSEGQISAAKVRELYDAGAADTSYEQRNHWVNWAFVRGEQNISWNEGRSRPDTLPEYSPARTRHINNRLWPSLRTLVAKLVRRPLVFEVPPTAPDDVALSGARLAEAVLAHAHASLDWEQLRTEQAWATMLGGTGLLALEWDPTAGHALGETEDGKAYGTGEVRCFALNVCEAVTEPGARDIERARWWIRAAVLPPKEVRSLYKMEADPPADATAMLSPLQHKLLSSRSGSDSEGALALVLTYYERPGPEAAGQVVVVVGEQVVSRGTWPFPFTERLNVVAAKETLVLGRWTADTILSAAVPVQRALNRAEDSIDEHMDKAGFARPMAPEGSVDPEMWTDDPSDVLEYRPVGTDSGRPEYLSPPTMPSWWQLRPGELKADIDDILGVHDVSRGEVPSGAGSGVALSLLAEADDTPIGALAKSLSESWGRFATLVLRTYADKVKEHRTATLASEGELPEVLGWNGAQLARQTTAHVPLDATGPASRGAQLQKGLLLLDKGVFGPPGEPVTAQRFARFADLPGANDLVSDLDDDVAKARRENRSLALGIVCVPAEFDDHAKHIAEINRFRKSAAYELLAPERQELFDLHAQAHETMAAEEAGALMAKTGVSPALAGAGQAHEPAPLGAPTPVPGDEAEADPDAGPTGPAFPVPAGAAGPMPAASTQVPG